MIKIISVLAFVSMSLLCFGQPTFHGDTTPTYDQAIAIYEELASKHVNATLYQKGPTDSGKPLHMFVISNRDMPGIQPFETRQFDQRVVLINNGIHSGEACGINASIMLSRFLLEDERAQELLQNTVVCIVPIYSIGGSLQRNSHSRANQEGPAEYGFRGNARNLDLNRDFTKMDSYNAQSFAKMFHEWDPHVYLETHTSNGADYQYTMTLLSTQKDKLDTAVSEVMQSMILPGLYKRMSEKQEEMVRYVNVFGRSPEEAGITGFLDSPRYSSGFATQFQCMGFMSEAHMLKPFEDRVNATFELMLSLLEEVEEHGKEIALARYDARNALVWQEAFPLNWELDTVASDTIQFNGYRSEYRKSAVTGRDRLYYDRAAPTQFEIPVYDHYRGTNDVMKPRYYVVPQARREVIERLHHNGVEMLVLVQDTILESEVYYISHFNTVSKPYEGHYLHDQTEVRTEVREEMLRAGDVLVPMYTDRDRFVVEVLEPSSADSYFNWNFFDEILQQKEWFSGYVFEDEAARMLEEDEGLRSMFEQMKADPEFAESPFAQLYWLYQQSPHYEEQHMKYPVLRIMNEHELPTRPMRP